MDFEKFKKLFDKSFAKVTPQQFVKEMEELGYKFEKIDKGVECLSLSAEQFKLMKIAELMQYKLDKNKYKECAVMNPDGNGRTWDKCDVRWLLMRLREEVDEIEKALNDNEAPIEIAKECADACNFSMMIADRVGGLDGGLDYF